MPKPVILCVDDEPIVLTSLREQLRRNLADEVQVELAQSGSEALELFAELAAAGSQVAVIIADQIMPGMKGDALLVKVHATYPSALKVLLTGQASADEVGKSVNQANLYRYIAKPWDELDLCLTVREALRVYRQDQELIAKNRELEALNASLEHKVRQRSAQLEQRNLQLEEKNHVIARLSGLKDQLIGTVSHDLKNPIGVIIGNAKLLLSVDSLAANVAQSQSMLQSILKTAEKMLNLVNDLLDLSRIDQGMPLQIQPVSLADLLKQVVDHFTLLSQQKSIRLQLRLSVDGLMVAADPMRLEQVFSNLLSNALKYTPHFGEVTIKAELVASQVVIEFIDTGIGIPTEDLDRVFDKFYRVIRDETESVSGTGLGLAITKGIIDQHGGTIRVDSQLGKGSTFCVCLPLNGSG